jgi:hypothetical protein
MTLRKICIALTIGTMFVALSSGAYADETSGNTRAQVKEELHQAIEQGKYPRPEYVDWAVEAPRGTLSRAEVQAQAGQSPIFKVLKPGDTYFGG